MKANELMIGDWVMFPNSIEKVQEVAYIEGKGYCASFAASATLFPIPIDKLKPIPLTTEILEKSGLEHNKGEMYYHGKLMYHHESKYVSICYGANNYWHLHINNGCDFSKAIKYVHELQHALKLCGIEKTIKL